VRARDWMMPLLRERLASRSAEELGAAFDRHGLPYAPITRPQDLFDDPHLNATGASPREHSGQCQRAGRAIETAHRCCR